MPDVEIWKPVKGFEGLYEVSSLGRVRSVERRVKSGMNRTRIEHAKIRKIQRTKNGSIITLRCNGIQYGKSVANLVAEAFLGAKPSGDPHIRHIDGNLYNNAVSNLRYRKAFYLPENTEARKLFSECAEKNVLIFIHMKHKCLNMGIVDINDFKQEALLKIWKDIDTYDEKVNFLNFCFTKCNDVFCMLYKKYSKIKSREISAYETYGDDTNPRYLIDTLACTDNFYERIDENA